MSGLSVSAFLVWGSVVFWISGSGGAAGLALGFGVLLVLVLLDGISSPGLILQRS